MTQWGTSKRVVSILTRTTRHITTTMVRPEVEEVVDRFTSSRHFSCSSGTSSNRWRFNSSNRPHRA